MIEHLSGTLLLKEPWHAIIEVGGVGYGVDVTPRTIESFGEAGTAARLWVYTYVREEVIGLYGFETRAERQAFEILLGVSGVGPKMALLVLGGFSLEQLIQIVLVGDVKRLSTIPGIGAKKAEKLLLELKGKVKALSAGLGAERLAEIKSGAAAEDSSFGPAAQEAIAGLEALGVQPAAARRAALKALEILGDAADTESLLREGLKHRHA